MDRQGRNGLTSHPGATEWRSRDRKGEGDLESEGSPRGHREYFGFIVSLYINEKENYGGKKNSQTMAVFCLGRQSLFH